MTPSHPQLLAIVSVERERRVLCQNPGCGHGVYAAIHVVQDSDQLLVLGSTCYAKRYGGAQALGNPAYSAGSSGGSLLTAEERNILANNTAELVALLKARHEAASAEAQAKLRALREHAAQRQAERQAMFAPRPAAQRPRLPPHPWPWQHTSNTSVAVLRGPDGQHWVRVLHRDGRQRLAPWPMFDGWDETFPRSVGAADEAAQAYLVPDIVAAISWLRTRGFSAPQVSSWPDVLQILPALLHPPKEPSP